MQLTEVHSSCFTYKSLDQLEYEVSGLTLNCVLRLHRMRFFNNLDNFMNPLGSLVHHIHKCRSAEHDIISNLAEQYDC